MTSILLSPKTQKRLPPKAVLGCYPHPPTIVALPKFGPDCVPPAIARQVDSYFSKLKAEKSKKNKGKPPVKVAEVQSAREEDYSLCLPQSPSRFSSSNVNESVHPRPSILQNPQRIVADGLFAVNEPVKPKFINVDFDSLQPLRLTSVPTTNETRNTLRDLKLLVQASLRSRNVKDEATAYFNIGMLYEKEGQLKKANSYYLKFLQTLGADADPLVFNRIAVNLHLLGRLEDAIEWNLRHLSFGRSLFEVIAANCNIALIYKELGENSKSIEFYRAALETAAEMDEPEESPFFPQIEKIMASLNDQIKLAENETKLECVGPEIVANSFGDRMETTQLNSHQVDVQQDFYKQQAQLSIDQRDLATAYGALISSGKLNCALGEFEKSEELYLKALEVALEIGSPDLIAHVKVAIGIVRGNKDLKKAGLFVSSNYADVTVFFK